MRHSRDEAVQLDRAQDRTGLWVDLVDHPLAVLADQQRTLGRRAVGSTLRSLTRGLWRLMTNAHWAREYFVSTGRRNEAVVREYIKHQQEKDVRLDQMQLRS